MHYFHQVQLIDPQLRSTSSLSDRASQVSILNLKSVSHLWNALEVFYKIQLHKDYVHVPRFLQTDYSCIHGCGISWIQFFKYLQ